MLYAGIFSYSVRDHYHCMHSLMGEKRLITNLIWINNLTIIDEMKIYTNEIIKLSKNERKNETKGKRKKISN